MICCNDIFIDNKSFLIKNKVENIICNKIITKNKSNFDLFVTLRESAYSLRQIYENKLLEFSYGILKNYSCKYKKLQSV